LRFKRFGFEHKICKKKKAKQQTGTDTHSLVAPCTVFVFQHGFPAGKYAALSSLGLRVEL